MFDYINALIKIIGEQLYELLSTNTEHKLGENGKDKDYYLADTFHIKEKYTRYLDDGSKQFYEEIYSKEFLVNENGFMLRESNEDGSYSCPHIMVEYRDRDFVYSITEKYRLKTKASLLLEEYVIVEEKIKNYIKEET